MTAPPQGPFEGLVDLKILLERLDDDRELLRELFGIFQMELPLLQSDLQRALQSGNLQGLMDGAHTLKGMFANLAISTGAPIAADLEDFARAGDKDAIATVLIKFDNEMATLMGSIDAYFGPIWKSP